VEVWAETIEAAVGQAARRRATMGETLKRDDEMR
jgi:hypothetical protein